MNEYEADVIMLTG